MPDFKGIVKNGWHPEKPGTTFKSQMGSLVGRKNSDDKRREDYVARPISSLRDPSSFAPPPRRDPRDPLPAVSRTNTASSAASGAPPTPARADSSPAAAEPPPYTESNRYAQRHQAVEEEEAPQKKPWSLNTTGLRTDHLPPPPSARRNPAAPPPPPAARASPSSGPPSLPPRLPPRAGSGASSPAAAPSPPLPPTQPPSTSSGYLNQSAISRLGSSGISVPGFGIGKSTSPQPAASPSAPPPSQMNELQNRFSKLGKSSLGSGGSTAAPPPTEGTTMEQKQAALRTASNFHKDPSSVSMSDARGAASTFNNFRQRHGDQVASGVRSANNLNQKYGVADKLGGFAAAGGQAQVGRQEEGVVGGPSAAPVSPGVSGVLGKKKPPPPPPKKKPGLGGPPPPPGPNDDDAPPPIPLSTRPNW